MSMFTLAIFCLTTSNLPWFMDLTFQVPMQYCSLHLGLCFYHQSHPAGYCFCFGSIPSFSLKLFLHWSPVVCWAPTDLGSSSFSIQSSCLFILFMGFSRQGYWSGLPFPSPVDHILSDLSTMTHPSWVAPWAWLSFIELEKFHWVRQGCGPRVIRLTSFLWVWFQCVCPQMPSCNTYHLTWVSLTLGVGYLFTAAAAITATAPYLGWGVAPPSHHPWLWHGVSPLSRCPWPRMWGSSSRLVLTLGRYHLHIWGCWYFSWKSWF